MNPHARILLLVFLAVIAPTVFADGMIHVHDQDLWTPFMEAQQYSFINYSNGEQNMILTVETAEELKGDKAVWIFPVPAKPEETRINVIKGFPQLMGYDVEEEAEDSVNSAFMPLYATQIYALPFVAFMSMTMMPGMGSLGALEEGLDKRAYGVTVHRRIEKMGLTTELVSALDVGALANYMTSKGLDLPAASQAILDEYIGQEYCFVVSWVSNVEQFKAEQGQTELGKGRLGNTVGAFITFPTDKIFYPLKPTSVYGEQIVPAVIYVMDYVEPEMFSGTETDAEIEYFFQGAYTPPEDLRYFFNWQTVVKDLEYTKIKVNTPSNNFTQDLWVNASAPAKIKAAGFLNKHTFWFGLIIFVVCSVLASLVAALIVFRKNRPALHWFALWGLWNFVTLIGLLVASYAFKVNERFTKAKKTKVRADFGKVVKKALLLSLIVPGLVFVIFMALFVWAAASYGITSLELLLWLIPLMFSLPPVYVFTCLLVGPFVWGYYNNRKTMYYTAWFAGLFLAFTILLQVVILGIF